MIQTMMENKIKILAIHNITIFNIITGDYT